MRAINFIYVEKITPEDLAIEKEEWKKAGFEYVPFHFMVSFKDVDTESVSVTKGRPLNMNNGLIRDSFLSQKGIGFLLVINDYNNVNQAVYDEFSKTIKNTIVDIGINDYQLATNYVKEERKLDIIKLHAAILNAETNFLKL